MGEDAKHRDLQDLRDKSQEHETRATEFLTEIEALLEVDAWLRALLSCHDFAVARAVRPGSLRDYHEAYAQLSSIFLANAESARLLLLRGFFGNYMAVLRTIANQNDLLRDISLHQESLRRWLALRDVRFSDRSSEAKEARRYFLDAEVRKRVKSAGEEPFSQTFQEIGSEAVHATARGHFMFLVRVT